MSRIRGIEAKVQKDLQKRNEIIKKKHLDQSSDPKDDVERRQINDLLHKLPKLDKIFDVHRKIGEGTFSLVYLGSLRQQTLLPAADRQLFAIKHLVPTSHPARIEHELKCLQDMGGINNVISVELCLRHLDTIVFIMPYIPHKKFSEYVGEMDAEELKQYIRALLIALRHVHSFGVIHRDVKPSNFLYDRENRRYQLVDFGLAQRVVAPPEEAPRSHAAAKRRREQDEVTSPSAKRMALDLRVRARKTNCSVPIPAKAELSKVSNSEGPPAAHAAWRAARSRARGAGGARCACAGAAALCNACAARPLPRAPRAGTQGFRPPEVLLKFAAQTTAVDMWACGVVIASVLAARYPLFRATDDVTALAEITDLLGTAPVRRAAHTLGRRLVTSRSRPGLCLRKFAAHLRGVHVPPHLHAAPQASCDKCGLYSTHCLCKDETKPIDAFDPTATVCGFPDSAFALATQLLDPDPRTRLTAALALEHPFLQEHSQT